MPQIQVYPDQKQQTEAAIKLFINSAVKSVQQNGFFSVALSGGSTPEKLYAGLAAPEYQEILPWEKIHLFFGDERLVPPDHPDSNFRMVQKALLQRVSIPRENVHRVKTELKPKLSASSYEDEMKLFFKGCWPDFDLVLLGMGTDGHTASLFPNTTALNEEERWFVANYLPGQAAWRLTLTKNAINMARKIVVLVNGQSKADMLVKVLQNAYDPFNKPIQLIAPRDGKMVWLLDRAAASQLRGL